MTVLYTLLSVLAISVLSVIGVITLALRERLLYKLTLYLVSLAAGTLLGGSFLHLLPEAVERYGTDSNVWLLFLAGILIFFVLEKIVCWRHCHIPTSEDHPHHLGIMNLVGDGVHNFLDGILIAGSFLASPSLGVATTLAVALHEIPQEFGDFGVLIHAGYSKTKAILLNFLIALTAVLGAVITLIIGSQAAQTADLVVPIAAGGFLYIAASDLIPELRKDISPSRSIKQFLVILLGIGIMWGIKFVFSSQQ
jgi:zinc and cadmium transporter